MDVQRVIESLELVPHPEGGLYRETFRSTQWVTSGDGQRRCAGTAIFYLLREGEFSVFHRISSCEVWHHYDGGALLVHQLGVGSVRLDRFHPQCVVRAGAWQAAEPEGEAVLCGCTVAPGFEFDDLEIASEHELIRLFPKKATLIQRLTRKK